MMNTPLRQRVNLAHGPRMRRTGVQVKGRLMKKERSAYILYVNTSHDVADQDPYILTIR